MLWKNCTRLLVLVTMTLTMQWLIVPLLGNVFYLQFIAIWDHMQLTEDMFYTFILYLMERFDAHTCAYTNVDAEACFADSDTDNSQKVSSGTTDDSQLD